METWKGTYLENFMDCAKLLPNAVNRNLLLMRELDHKADVVQRRVDQQCEDILTTTTARKAKPEELVPPLTSLRTDQLECKALHAEKLATTRQCLDIVQSYLQRIEKDMKAFEHELGANVPPEDWDPYPPKKRTKGRYLRNAAEDVAMVEATPMDTTAAISDAPVDSEEMWCICKKPQHGQMIGCDNQSCYIEWYHMDCMGMDRPPKGKWLCPDCKKRGFKIEDLPD